MPTPDSESNQPAGHPLTGAQLASEVGDCPQCGALFTLPLATEPFDSIACPVCEQSVSIDAIELRKVHVATPIQKELVTPPEPIVPTETATAKPEQSLPTVADLLARATAPKPSTSKPIEEPVATDPGHESLDDWLRRTTGVPVNSENNRPSEPIKTEPIEAASLAKDLSEKENASNETVEIPNPTQADLLDQNGTNLKESSANEAAIGKANKEKKALSDTLGWAPGSFSLETPEETSEGFTPTDFAKTKADEPSLDFNTKKTVENIDDFVNSLGGAKGDQPTMAEAMSSDRAASADEHPSETSLASDESVGDFQFDFKETLLEAADTPPDDHTDQFEPTEVSDAYEIPVEASPTSKSSSGWGAPLSALAGLLVVGGVSYVFVMDQFLSDDLPKNEANRVAIVAPAEPMQTNKLTTIPENDDLDSSERPVGTGVEVANFETTEQIETRKNETLEASSFTASEDSNVGDRYTQQQDRYSEPNPFAEANALPFDQVEETPSENESSAKEDLYHEQSFDPTTAVEEQASFTEPATEATDFLQQENAKPDSLKRLIGAPFYGMEDLQAAIDYSSPAGSAFSQGTLSDPEQAQEMGKLYGDLCYLAQVVTLLDMQNAPSGMKTAELLAIDVYKRMLKEQGKGQEINQVAGHWINWTGRPYGGVFFQGIPDQMSPAGELFQYRFPMGDSYAYVVTEEAIDINRYIANDAKRMGIVGIVVEEPTKRLVGYQGDAERVIWCRKTIPISDKRWGQ